MSEKLVRRELQSAVQTLPSSGTAGSPVSAKQNIDTFMPGTKYSGRKLIEKLGTGMTGETWLAEYEGEQVVLKIPYRIEGLEHHLRELYAEVQAIQAIDHPSLARLQEYDLKSKKPFVQYEHVPAKSLREAMQEKPLQTEIALHITDQLLACLYAVHNKSIGGKPLLHRDIKPENILITEDGLRLIDFGLSSIIDQMRESVQCSIVSGNIVGTLGYLSPETEKNGEYSPKSDIYSVGVVLYEMLTGKNPKHLGFKIMKELQQKLGDKPREKSIISALEKALEPDTKNRYQTAQEFRTALQEADNYETLTEKDIQTANKKIDEIIQPTSHAQRFYEWVKSLFAKTERTQQEGETKQDTPTLPKPQNGLKEIPQTAQIQVQNEEFKQIDDNKYLIRNLEYRGQTIKELEIMKDLHNNYAYKASNQSWEEFYHKKGILIPSSQLTYQILRAAKHNNMINKTFGKYFFLRTGTIIKYKPPQITAEVVHNEFDGFKSIYIDIPKFEKESYYWSFIELEKNTEMPDNTKQVLEELLGEGYEEATDMIPSGKAVLWVPSMKNRDSERAVVLGVSSSGRFSIYANDCIYNYWPALGVVKPHDKKILHEK